jgi:RNA polymerase sigma factor (sigma-70 family)
VKKQEVVIWNRFREGDDQAFAELFETYSDILFRYGLKFIDNEEDVKDCIQELFIKLYDNRKSLLSVENVKLYLLKSLKNRIIDHIRKENNRAHTLPLDDLQFSANYYFDPEEETDQDQGIMEKFDSVLKQLTNRQKEILYLHYQMGLSYQDICLLLDINYQSVKNLMFRTVDKIRKEMELSPFLFLFLQYIQ